MPATQSKTDTQYEVPTSIYERTLQVIDAQTSEAQSPTVEPRVIRTIMCSYANYDPSVVDDALWIANDRNDILSIRDDDGTLALCPANEATLRRLIGRENAKEHPNTNIIEAAVALIQAANSGDEGPDGE